MGVLGQESGLGGKSSRAKLKKIPTDTGLTAPYKTSSVLFHRTQTLSSLFIHLVESSHIFRSPTRSDLLHKLVLSVVLYGRKDSLVSLTTFGFHARLCLHLHPSSQLQTCH